MIAQIQHFPVDSFNVKIVLTLTIGFALASLLGYITQRAKLSPILGYLFAGYAIGPYSPGFVANIDVAEQLAEIGVILMMFGVGLHFKWQELVRVKNIAIPGAIGQTFIAAVLSAVLIHWLGWSWEAGLVVGFSIGVASTVVMVRVLFDNKLLATPQGHIAVGWLIVEDIITIILLLLLPSFAFVEGETFHWQTIAVSLAWAMLKCLALIFILALWGFKVVSYIFLKIARTRSQELFTITVLALTFCIATGAAFVFGTSIALGAFIAGMMIGQTEVRHQALAHSLPLKDTFAVIFFLSVGMLFNPMVITQQLLFFLVILAIILIIKPLSAYFIVRLFKYPIKVAIVVALALAQIGEFSFILSEQAMKINIIPDEAYDLIVACALITIAINPLLFKTEGFLRRHLDHRQTGPRTSSPKSLDFSMQHLAIVVGYGPIGQAVTHILEQMSFKTVIIDNNVDTVARLEKEGKAAIFGDVVSQHILEAANIKEATLLALTVPEGLTAVDAIRVARELNPGVAIIARTNFTSEKNALRQLDVYAISGEEETKQAFISALWNIPHIARKHF